MYLKLALRILWRNRLYTGLNLAGLTFGFLVFLLLALFVADEFRFDAQHERAGRIFRVVEEKVSAEGKPSRVAAVGFSLGERAAAEVTGVEGVAKLSRFGRSNLTNPETQAHFYEPLWVLDPGFGELFDFEWLAGDKHTALREPNGAIMTETMARKLYGDPAQALGRAVQTDYFEQPLRVTGVLRDFPKNSTVDFNFAVSESSFYSRESFQRMRAGDWASNTFPTFLLLGPAVEPAAVARDMNRWVAGHRQAAGIPASQFTLLPLRDQHFKGVGIAGMDDVRLGNETYVWAFVAVALFVLAIACINFINLTTARASARSREIGIRRTAGARTGQLASQFLLESLLVVGAAFVLALGLVQLLLPRFNIFTDKNLVLEGRADPLLWALLLGSVAVVWLVAGLYPAWTLARQRPSFLLKNIALPERRRFSLRQGLVVSQFALSVLLLIATAVVWQQVQFVKNKPLGFNRDQLLVIDINSGNVRRGADLIKAEMANIPGVAAVSVSSRVPGEWKSLPVVSLKPPGTETSAAVEATFLAIDADFLQTFEVQCLQGRNFDANLPADTNSLLLNEMAAAALGIREVADQWIEIPSVAFSGNSQPLDQPFRGRVKGIVRDFHWQSLREKIGPLVMAWQQNPIHPIDYFTLRVQSVDYPAVLSATEATLQRVDPNHLFEYNFLDDQWARFYRDDARRETVLRAGALAALFIACLGLFGLATYTAERRTREIGIRKTLGATVTQITALLAGDFLRLVFIAVVLAAPAGWWLMQRWLQDFAYRTSIGWEVFVLAGALAAVIALVTISFQSIRAALVNPVESLRSE